HGGCFPIILKGTGPVGTVTVSGLPQLDDHRLAVEALELFLNSKDSEKTAAS
ncbi:heme-binding protein, partial [Micromonospora sp. NPDC004551]|uniref:heme-binding protein n=1 Tax=Micromonospora sp. NPDC004551 TaxID=3154284 RepID=UPI0033ADACE9